MEIHLYSEKGYETFLLCNYFNQTSLIMVPATRLLLERFIQLMALQLRISINMRILESCIAKLTLVLYIYIYILSISYNIAIFHLQKIQPNFLVFKFMNLLNGMDVFLKNRK